MNTGTRDSLQQKPQIALDRRAREVLDYWLGAPDSAEYGRERRFWFQPSTEVDAVIRSRFLSVHTDAVAGKCNTWTTTTLGACALILVFDQFSRHLYRGTPDAFASDARALAITRNLVEQGEDQHLPTPYHRCFVYLPFEHDESMHSQRESLRLFEALKHETGLTTPFEWAVKHAEVIERFGRYPHRNKILGRLSSTEEAAFLREPGSSF